MAKEIVLRPYQEYAIEQLRNGIRAGTWNQCLCAPTGAGKCLGKDTPVLMSNGSIKMVQDVRVGDRLLGPDGTARNVLSITSGREQLYRIIPKKGDPYVVNASHILSLKKTPGSDGLFLSDGTHVPKDADIVNVNVETFAKSNASARHALKGWRSGCVGFEREEDDVENLIFIPAYIMGAWLGDGSRKDAVITKPNCKMIGAWRRYAKSIGTEIYNQASEDRCPMWRLKDGFIFRNAIEIYFCGSKEKFIPNAYKYASRDVRLQLIAGMIDSDGGISHNACDWISKSERLAKDFAFVCRSLGFSCYVSKQVKRIKSTGFSGEYWRASLSGDLSIIPTKDKVFGKRKQKKRTQVHSIQIQDIGIGEYYGFEIDGDRLFLLGDFTVTHNTVLAAHLIQECYKKVKRAVFVVDRVNLIDQTSAVFDSYGIPHGVMQSQHWRHRPWERVQLCSAQTLARRKWPEADLIIIDECHTISKVVKDRLNNRDTIAIGLTATPFTKGMGQIYDSIINVTATQTLIDEGFLSKFRIFACQEPDMKGVRTNNFGEWVESEASKRALEVVGDCVQEYRNYADGKKFICSACDTAHVEELHKQFTDAGIICEKYTYKVSDEERAEIIQEFRKPDSYIRGIITVTAATKGFDVPDIECVIMARPLRNSISEHIQFLGRGLRPFPGKEECIVLDHSGNCLRFMKRMLDFFSNGASELDDGKTKERKKRVEEEDIEDKYQKCPNCKCLHTYAPTCPNCGHIYPPKKAREHKKGTMKELLLSGSRKELTVELWPQIVAWSKAHKPEEKQRNFALAMFKRMTNSWPTKPFEETVPAKEVSEFVSNKITSLNIAYAHGMRKRAERKST